MQTPTATDDTVTMMAPPPTDDGPAVAATTTTTTTVFSFEADPKVSDIFECTDGDYFGLVLVAGWPPEPTLDAPYQEFLNLVQTCFHTNDLTSNIQIADSSTTATKTSFPLPAAVYLYPSIHLHVTVATFAPPEKKASNVVDFDYSTNYFQSTCLSIVQEASTLANWPKQPIQLMIHSTQLGQKAGILLWDDISGGIPKIRQCIQQVAAAQRRNHFQIGGIPNIIHSTFLRFSQVPSYTKADVAQERYQTKVLPQIQTIFKEPIKAKTVKLVLESTPYMHIPEDEQHVIHSWELCDEEDLCERGRDLRLVESKKSSKHPK